MADTSMKQAVKLFAFSDDPAVICKMFSFQTEIEGGGSSSSQTTFSDHDEASFSKMFIPPAAFATFIENANENANMVRSGVGVALKNIGLLMKPKTNQHDDGFKRPSRKERRHINVNPKH